MAPAPTPVPGSAADVEAFRALAASQAGGGGLPPLPPGYTLDPAPGQSSANPGQPWLNDPPVKQAPGAYPDAPWLDDPPVVGHSGSLPPLPPGYTLDAPPKDTSYGSALQEGVHDAGAGLGATLSVLAHDVGWKGGDNAGKWLQNAIPAPANYSSAVGGMAAKLKAGQILGALRDIPRAAVEATPSLLGGLGAAAAAAAVTPELLGGAAVGGALGAAGYGAGSAFGQDAQARAAANGHAQPTTGDQLAAGATAAAQGALGAAGLRKVPGVSSLLARSPAFIRSLASPAALDAAGQGVSNVVGQVGTTAGTTQGLTVDPAEAAAAALQAASARRLSILGPQVGKVAVGAAGAAKQAVGNKIADVGTNMAVKGLPPMSDEQAASITRINNALDQQAPANPNANGVQRVNGLWKQQRAALGDTINAAIQSGKVDQSTGAALQTAMQQAAVHKSALDTNLLTRLNSPSIDPQLATTLRNGLTDLDGLSQMVNYKQATGPYAALASKIVNGLALGTAALAGIHGDFGAASEIGLGAIGGHASGVTGLAGKVLGGGLDRIAGTAQPPAILLRTKALQQANAAGTDTSGNSLSPITSAGDAMNALRAQQQQDALNAAAKAKAANLQEAAANTVSGMAYKNSPEGIIARANAAARKKDILNQAATDGTLRQPMTQDELDRVSMGLSPRDPIQVNTPLDANNQPIGQSGPGVAPGGPRVAPQSAPQAAPQGGPAGPQAAGMPTPQQPQAAGSLPVGWLTHLHTALSNAGLPATPDVIGRALGGAVAKGRIGQDFADWLLANPGQFVGDRSVPFQHLVAQAQENAGMTPNPVVAPVQSPIKHANAVQDYRTLGNTLQDTADAMGDLGLKVAIARIMSTSSAQQKADIANQEFTQRSHDADALARAKQLLPPELLKSK